MQLLTVEKLAMLLGLSFFFGLSFEGFYWKSAPGGIRTFPLISLSGAILYALEPQFATAFCVGLITLAQFLVLIGVVLPLFPNTAVTSLTPITPFQVWLAVVVVSSLSYGSYLLHGKTQKRRFACRCSTMALIYDVSKSTSLDFLGG